jgi:hypothetical protein
MSLIQKIVLAITSILILTIIVGTIALSLSRPVDRSGELEECVSACYEDNNCVMQCHNEHFNGKE